MLWNEFWYTTLDRKLRGYKGRREKFSSGTQSIPRKPPPTYLRASTKMRRDQPHAKVFRIVQIPHVSITWDVRNEAHASSAETSSVHGHLHISPSAHKGPVHASCSSRFLSAPNRFAAVPNFSHMTRKVLKRREGEPQPHSLRVHVRVHELRQRPHPRALPSPTRRRGILGREKTPLP